MKITNTQIRVIPLLEDILIIKQELEPKNLKNNITNNNKNNNKNLHLSLNKTLSLFKCLIKTLMPPPVILLTKLILFLKSLTLT